MVLQQKKSGKLMWTQAWRRLNKKGKDEGVAKKKARKTVRVQRAIGSFTKEEIAAKKVAFKPKDAATEAALKEVKERTKAQKKAASAATANKAMANIPKTQKQAQANSRGGSKR